MEALEVVARDIPSRCPCATAIGPLSLNGGLSLKQIVEWLLDVGLVVVVGVDVKVLDTAETAEFVEKIALLACTGRVTAGHGEVGISFFDHGVEDGEEVVSLEAVGFHGRVGERIEVGSELIHRSARGKSEGFDSCLDVLVVGSKKRSLDTLLFVKSNIFDQVIGVGFTPVVGTVCAAYTTNITAASF